MNEQVFWTLVKEVNKEKISPRLRINQLIANLAKLELKYIFKFDKVLFWLLNKANFADLWAAHAVLTNEYGEISFLHFRYWLIFQGQRIFKKTLDDPEFLEIFIADFKNQDIQLSDYAGFEYIAQKAYQEKTGVYDYQEKLPYQLVLKNIQGQKPNAENEIADLLPLLCKKMGWNSDFLDGHWISDDVKK